MASKSTHHRRNMQLHDHRARSDALVVGPGGLIEEAYGEGTRAPAIPEVVTGRLQHFSQDPNGPTTAFGASQSVFVTFSSSPGDLMSPTSVASGTSPSSLVPLTASDTSSASISSIFSVASLVATSSSLVPTTMVSSSFLISSAPSSSSSSLSSSAISSSTLSSTSTSSSVSASPTASADPASSAPRNRRDVYFGIALAAIAAVGLLVVLVTWCYRTRSRSRRLDQRQGTSWPWDRRRNDTEAGLGATKEYPFGRFGSMNEKERVDGELPYPQFPARTLGADEMLRASQHLPSLNSPFRPVIPHLHSVPDLTPNLGFLQVANYVPGDTSSEEGSRANSRQGLAPSVKDIRSPAGEWATYGPEDGFQHPWPPLKPRRGLGISSAGTSPQASDPENVRPAGPQPLRGSWGALRSSISSALNVMVGGLERPVEDKFTRLPERRGPAHDTTNSAPEVRVQSSSTSVLTNPFGDPSEADAHSPCDASDNAHHDPNCLCEWLKQKQSSLEHVGTLHPPLSHPQHDLLSPHSVYLHSPGQAASSPTPALSPIPMSRAGSVSSLHQAIKRKQLQRGRSKKFTGVLDRSHAPSTSSAGSDMSREPSTASTHSGPLSDQEQFASSALRERRKRVLDAQRLAARQSLKRPSIRLGSRRQKNGHRVLGAASALRERMAA